MMPVIKLHEAERNPEIAKPAPLGDLRFRKLLSKEEWESLPLTIRERFSKRVDSGATVVYAGEVVETKLSLAGAIIAHLARLVGGPLPLWTTPHVPAVVTVTEDARNGGQVWTRLYARKTGFPQIVHSSKQFAGDTGLEEHVGCGVGMALTVHAQKGALVFKSKRYFVDVGPLRVTLPAFLTPGALTVTHAEEDEGRFSFLLEIAHPFFGPVIRQLAMFREVQT